MKRRMKLVALILVPAVLLASLSSLASNKDGGRVDDVAARGTADRLADQKNGRLLLPVALDQNGKGGQGRLSKEARNRLLEDLQVRVGEYRPWPKAHSGDSLRLDRRAQ